MENCIVTRNFRGAVLFLVAAAKLDFKWSADRSKAARFTPKVATETARAASEFDLTQESARVVDSSSQVIEPAVAGRELTRDQKLKLIWRHTHRDFKSSNIPRTLLVNRGGAKIGVRLEALTDAEIAQKLPHAMRKEKARTAVRS